MFVCKLFKNKSPQKCNYKTFPLIPKPRFNLPMIIINDDDLIILERVE